MDNKVLSQLRMIIFDVDGTLAETDDYYVDKSAALIRKILPFMSAAGIGKVIRPVINTGETIVHSFYRLLDTVGLDTVVSKIHSRASVKESYKYELIEGTVETLEILSKKYKLGIITSGGRHSTESFIKKYRLEKFISYIISAEDCRFIKPHPMPLQELAKRAEVPISACLMVGDTVFDIMCARRAGAYSAAVKTGFDSDWFLRKFHADVTLDSVKELPGILLPKAETDQTEQVIPAEADESK